MEQDTLNTSTLTVPQDDLVLIRELTDLKILRKNLIAISYLLGVKDAPEENIMNQMTIVIRDEFGFFSTQDITNAVKKALSGKLGIDINTYNNFTIPYICRILIAYRQYLSDQGLLLRKETEEPKEPTDEEKEESTKRWLDKCIYPHLKKFFEEGNYNFPDYANTFYNYLDGAILNFSTKRKQRIKNMARKELIDGYKAELYSKNDETLKRTVLDIEGKGKDTNNLVKTHAKKIALREFLNKCKESEIDLIAEIKKYEVSKLV